MSPFNVSFFPVNLVTNLTSLILYPNPTTSQLNVNIKDGSYDRIIIFSSTGQLIKTIEPNSSELTIDVSQYASGLYFARFVKDKSAFTKRFIKK